MARRRARSSTARGKKGNPEQMAAALGLAGAVLLLPFLITSIVYFNILKNRYLQSPSAQRVVDFYKVFWLFAKGAIAAGVIGFFSIVAVMSILDAFIGGENPSNASQIVAWSLALIPLVIFGIILGLRVAVFYLGIIADGENDILFFPHDMRSYTLGDYISMRFIKGLYSISCVKLSEISRITRGYGVELYIHGAFGSRKITMHDKQKRDECIFMIRDHSGKKGIVGGEIENY